ncbi:hypothetical protein Mapa_011083 [Marchantia paleacea]|nr:hypothetical protein Mapa_011083 [Marchantia paleacea]
MVVGSRSQDLDVKISSHAPTSSLITARRTRNHKTPQLLSFSSDGLLREGGHVRAGKPANILPISGFGLPS